MPVVVEVLDTGKAELRSWEGSWCLEGKDADVVVRGSEVTSNAQGDDRAYAERWCLVTFTFLKMCLWLKTNNETQEIYLQEALSH